MFRFNLETNHAYLNADNNTDFASRLIERAERHFGKKEVRDNVSEFYSDYLSDPTSGTLALSRCVGRTKQLIELIESVRNPR